MGHVGDKFGRKKVLTFTLLLMGLSTFLIGAAADLRPGRHRRADPAGAAAPAAGPFGGRRAGRRQLDDARARTGAPARVLHQLHARAARRWASSSRRSCSCRSRRCRRTSCCPGAGAMPFFLSADRRRRRLLGPPHPARDAGVRGRGQDAHETPSCRWPTLFQEPHGRTWCASSSPPWCRWSARSSACSRCRMRSTRCTSRAPSDADRCWCCTNMVALAAIPALGDALGPHRPQAGVLIWARSARRC